MDFAFTRVAPITVHVTTIPLQLATMVYAPIRDASTRMPVIMKASPVVTTAHARMREQRATTTTRAPCSIR